MDLYYLNLFVRFTCNVLLRSKALWVCALLSFCCVNLFQIYFQSNFVANASPVGFVAGLREYAFPELIPYMNVYLSSVLSGIILLFFSVTFLHIRVKNGSMDVIGYRPESNMEYIWGTILGFLLVFGGIGLVNLLGGGIIHLLWSEAPFVIGYYFFYYFTLFIPGLLCWLGISFCTIFLIKERGISILFLLILYIVTTLYVSNYQGGIFDIWGIGLSNVFSQVTGHTNLREYLLQRVCWFLFGIGLLQGAILLFKRLPNSSVKTWREIITWTCLGSGCLLGILFFQTYRDTNFKRQVYSEIYTKFATVAKATVVTHDISFQRENNQMTATSDIVLQNQQEEILHEIIFYLNPTLKIMSIKWNDEEIDFEREYQVIRIKKEIQQNENVRVIMNYQGEIDENICYLDIPNSRVRNMDKHIACPIGKRYAFLESDYTLLVPEVLWYPVTEPPVNTIFRNRVSKNFTRYSLKVLGETDKVVISQGERVSGNEYTFFRNLYPLTGISICIGDYEVRSVQVDTVCYEFYLLKGKFVPKSTDIREPYGTLMPDFLSEMKVFCEKNIGRKYPYNYFRMIESPVTFTSYYREYKKGSEFVQPEIVFFKERGKNDIATRRALLSAESLQRYLEILLCNDYQDKDNFTWKHLFDHQINDLNAAFKNIDIEPNLHNVSSMFYWQMNDIHAEDYPELEMFFLWLIRYFENSFNPVITIGLDNQVEFAALNYLQKHNLGYAIADKTLSMEMCRQIFDIKMEELLNRVIIEGVDEERLKVFILHLMEKYNFKRIEYEDVNQSFRDEIGINLSSILSAWYKNIGVPNYIVETFKVQRVGEDRVDRASSARVYFKIFNDSDVDGIVNIQSSNAPFIPDMTIMKSCETREVNLRFRIPAKTGKEVSLLLSDSPEYYALKLNACGNIPNSMYTRLDNFIGELDTLSYVREFDQTRIQIDTNEIIVDNEDAGFQVINSGTFYHLLEGGKQNITDKYTNMTHWLIPDDHWRYFIDYNAYGKFVRSAVIRNSGKGMTCAEWSVDLKRKGRYEVFVYLPKFTYSKVFTKNRNPDINSLPFTYTISSTDGENEITIQTKQDKEWVSLGVYNYTPGHYSVKLSDKGEADYSVVADAVKWVYIE